MIKPPRLYLGAMNDTLFAIDTPPRPSADAAHHERTDGPKVMIPLGTDNTFAERVVAAWNAALITATPLPKPSTARGAVAVHVATDPPAEDLAYDIEASHYPEDEPEADTAQLMSLLAEIAHHRRQIMGRPEPDADFPQIGRYREMALAVECLIDCGGYPFPDYRQKLVGIAALALDALFAFDGAPRSPAAS